MHAAALALKRTAFAFPGVSSAGKTTISKCAKKATVLNDEIICIDASKKKIAIHATPFWGEMGTGPHYDRAYPLRAILFPRKARAAAHTKRISGRAALQILLRCCCVFGEDTALCARVLEICIRLTDEVPMARLFFAKNADIDAVLLSMTGRRNEAR